MNNFIDLAEIPGEVGREDTQGCWQHVVAGYLNNCTLLDVGAGLNGSKERMSVRNIEVTTQDPGPGLPVDLHCDVSEIESDSFDYVTAFDVIEHIKEPEVFLNHLKRIARRAVILTTPNIEHTGGTHVYHFKEYRPSELANLLRSIGLEPIYAWMTFPDGPPNIRRAMISELDSDRFCYNFCIVAKK